jgi:hypothetical protein
VLAATVKVIVPLPVPPAPLLIVIQDELVAAVQGQPDGVVMFTLPFVPPIGASKVVEDNA